jgi:hypothetical protein
MICPYKQTLEHFGVVAQFQKLREECLELAESVSGLESALVDGEWPSVEAAIIHVYDESGDVLNVLRSIMTRAPKIEQMAATKMLRTQIRIKTGYYDGGGI